MVNRGEEKVWVQMNVVPRSTGNTNSGTENSHRGQKIFSLPRVAPSFPLLGPTPSGLFMGLLCDCFVKAMNSPWERRPNQYMAM